MNQVIQYLVSQGMHPDQAMQVAARLFGPAVQNSMQATPAPKQLNTAALSNAGNQSVLRTTPGQPQSSNVELGPAEVTNAPIQWAKAPQNPQDRDSAQQATQSTVGVLDSFGALPGAHDGVDAYWARSRGINDVHAAANQYQPNLTAETLLRLASALGMQPSGYNARAQLVDDTYRKTGARK